MALLLPHKNTVNFDHLPILVGSESLNVELARSADEMRLGLSGRDSLNSDGMLFIFDTEDTQSFWMKDTRFPLILLFFDNNKLLVDTQIMSVEPKYLNDDELKIYASRRKARYALEVPLNSPLKARLDQGQILSLRF